jgi:two-component system chemotaxis response regulator CheB
MLNVDRPRARAIAIGGSAGAIEALAVLLPAFPKETKIPIFVTVHLPPKRPSLLVSLFAAKCAMRVDEPFDKQTIEAGIWFAAPDYHMLVDGQSFVMSVDDPVNYSRPSIDVLFESAANAYGANLVGVVLTGTSEDGARGARAIRDAGGFVAVQDPKSADSPQMPNFAIERAAPQLVASMAGLASFLRDVALASEP